MRRRNGHAAAAGLALALCAPGAALAGSSDSTTGAFTGTIIRPILVTASQSLGFGTIVRPSSGSGVVTLANNGTLSVTGTGAVALPSTTPHAGMFTVSGEGGQVFTLAVDSTVTLTNAGSSGGSLSVTTSNDAACSTSCTLSGALGASGGLTFHVGGAFAISSTTHPGAYAGTLNISVAYN